MNLRVVTDGDGRHTDVFDADTGKKILNVVSITLEVSRHAFGATVRFLKRRDDGVVVEDEASGSLVLEGPFPVVTHEYLAPGAHQRWARAHPKTRQSAVV